jgi:hypothetical protein
MRTHQIRALALSVLLAFTLSSVPAAAAPGDDSDRGRVSPIVKVIKRITKFIVSALDASDGLTLPKP